MSSNAQTDQKKAFEVSASDAGQRLDAWLARLMPDHISRNRVIQLIRDGHVQDKNGKVLPPKYKLCNGDVFSLIIPEPDTAKPQPQDIPLDILYEDNDLIVINKPPGLVVHPAVGNHDGTLVNALLYHCGDSLSGIGGVRRPGIVHRLDKATSGVMVAAKTEEAHAGLASQFADHGRTGPLERAYLALVWGVPAYNKGSIDTFLGRAKNSRTKRAVVNENQPDARHAITHYTVKEHLDGMGDGRANASLLECRLETGRTHQIRVHMAHIGHPLIGDQEYGKHFATKAASLAAPAQKAVQNFKRQALHAQTLGFNHPVTGEICKFEAPVPKDMAALIASFE